MPRKKSEQFGEQFPTSKAVLSLLGVGAILTLSMFFPTAPMAIAPFVKTWQEFDRRRLRDQLNRLSKRGMVRLKDKNGDKYFQLTEKGRQKVIRYIIGEMKKKIPDKWDRKWRIIIFDVSEKKRNLRDAFRRMVGFFGFFQLQKSVFVYPYDCIDAIEYLKKMYEVEDEVIYFTTGDLIASDNMIAKFHLSR